MATPVQRPGVMPVAAIVGDARAPVGRPSGGDAGELPASVRRGEPPQWPERFARATILDGEVRVWLRDVRLDEDSAFKLAHALRRMLSGSALDLAGLTLNGRPLPVVREDSNN